jgi:mRNA-degrading endonuclease toxin of MazEF toxin-antitoxin module
MPFYRDAYSANCLVLYLLSSMVFTATVCQVSGSESVGTEVVVVVQTPIGHENFGSIMPMTQGRDAACGRSSQLPVYQGRSHSRGV